MKKWRRSGKIVLTLLLVLVLGLQTFQGFEISEVQATTVNADLSTEGKVTNGDFESGRVGYSVRGWSLISMNSSASKEDNPDRYTNNFTLKTESDGGSKVASLAKSGTGYAAMTSEHVVVEGQKTYQLSIDYKIKDYSVDIEPATGQPYTTNTDYFGIRFVVEQYDENGTAIVYSKYPSAAIKERPEEWTNHNTTFTTHKKTKSVVVYCWLGGGMRLNVTALFDNVTIESAEGKVSNGDFESGRVGDSIKKWSLISMNSSASKEDNPDRYTSNFTLKTESDGGSKVAALTKSGTGYAAMTSDHVVVEGQKTYQLSIDYKIKDYSVDIESATGQPYTSNADYYGIRFIVEQYDANGNALSYSKYPSTAIKERPEGWTNHNTTFTTHENAKSVVVYCWLGGGMRLNVTALFDNILLYADGDLASWTMERSAAKGVPRTDNTDYTQYYTIQKTNGGAGHENALQLRVTRPEGVFGGVVIYSAPVQVQSGMEYTTSYNLKVENYKAEEDTNSNKIYGAVGVLRYLDNQGNYINGNAPEICGNQRDNIDWTKVEYTFTPPAGTVSVQFGLVMGSNLRNICKNMAYSIDNIVILEKEAYEDYKKDPAVTSSALYKQSALFVGDSTGSGLAEQATSYSEMRVTNVCSDTVAVDEQLRSYAGGAYDYLIISGGMKENEANMPAGNVTADTVYMDGMDFDAATFAGVMENTFGKVTEYYNQQKVVYVLTTDNNAYREVAQKAATKWNVQLVMLGDVTDAAVSWNEIIEPAESANVYDCYQVPGLLDYLEKRVEAIVGTGITITSDMVALKNIKEKAQQCPDTHAEYTGYQALINTINGIFTECEDFRPMICGATVAVDDPNVLSFIALSPKKALSEGVKVKTMGILSMPITYLDVNAEEYKADAVLELNNAYVKNMEATYTEVSKEYRVYQEAWEADPYTEYVATAYVVYEANGEDYVFYSSNDYVNAVGIRTATGGRCIKSVFGISKTVAIQLATAKGNAMDFAAISGEDNLPLIHMATEETEVTLLDVYRLVGDNKVILEEWLGEGGATK